MKDFSNNMFDGDFVESYFRLVESSDRDNTTNSKSRKIAWRGALTSRGLVEVVGFSFKDILEKEKRVLVLLQSCLKIATEIPFY